MAPRSARVLVQLGEHLVALDLPLLRAGPVLRVGREHADLYSYGLYSYGLRVGREHAGLKQKKWDTKKIGGGLVDATRRSRVARDTSCRGDQKMTKKVLDRRD